MGLERWEEQYRSHPVWSLVVELQQTLSSHEERVLPEQRDYYDRLKFGLAYIAEMASEPVIVITPSTLANLHQATMNIHNQITNWVSGVGPHHLNAAAESSLDAAFDIIRNWPPSKDRYARGLRAAATDFMAGADSSLTSLKSEVEGLRNKISSMAASTQDDFTALLQAAQSDIAHTQEGATSLQADISAMNSTVTAQGLRLDQAISTYQASYAEAEASRNEAHQRSLEKLGEETATAAERARSQSDAILSEQKESALRILEEITILHDQTVKLVDAVGLTGTATEYGKYATQEQKAANSWRRGAVAVFACSFLLFLATLLVSHIDKNTPWQLIAFRFGGSLVLLAGGIYMARESSQHRQEERRAKSVQLDLAALDPFIVNLPTEQQESIKAAAAERLFVERSEMATSQPSGSSVLPEGVTPEALRMMQSLFETLKK